MQLHGALASPYVARVVLAARVKGLDLPPTMPAGGLKSPEFLALNPLGKIPTLEDGAHCLIESAVICEYLDEAYPGTPLWPADPFLRARGRTLGRLVDLYLMPVTTGIFRNLAPAARDAAELDTATAAVRKACAQLEHFLTEGPHALGAPFSLADCLMLPPFAMIELGLGRLGLALPFEATPKLARWWQTMNSAALTSGFLDEYRAAFNAFMNMRRG